MAIVYGAMLTSDNFDAFRRRLTDCPATFREWTHRRDQRAADTLSKRWKFVEIEVNLDEYIRDCDATHTPYNLHSLNEFAGKVALQKE